MNIVLTLVAMIGLYFILGFFSGLHATVGSAFGITFTWFGILFVIGSLGIAKVCLSK
jgi:multisubunit Na+/H+ antiporter MnhG subunit